MSIVSDLINHIEHEIIVHNVSICISLVSSVSSGLSIVMSLLTMHEIKKKHYCFSPLVLNIRMLPRENAVCKVNRERYVSLRVEDSLALPFSRPYIS